MSQSVAARIDEDVSAQLQPLGLKTFGWFADGGLHGLLVGNVGSSLWPEFSRSDEYADGAADPLNRWTERVVRQASVALATRQPVELRFPFGETIWPFQRYAILAAGMQSSPIGLLIHPEYGLWTAFRAAIMFADDVPLPESEPSASPCATCADRPCLSACPIGAFSDTGYDYPACKSYVASPDGEDCLITGCAARQACPVGQGLRYEQPHQHFHMKAFA